MRSKLVVIWTEALRTRYLPRHIAFLIELMLRTITTDRSSFTRTGQVTYEFSPTSNVVTISLPRASPWTSGLHWHETHTEYLQVIKGRALVTLEDFTKIYGPEDGFITVKKGMRHEWKLAPSAATDDDADVTALIVNEWTDPADGQKEIFFRNLSSVLMEPPMQDARLTLQLFCIFWALDNYPVLIPARSRTVEWAVTHLALIMASVVGRFLGVKGVYEEYTPKPLWDRWNGYRAEKID